MASLKPESTLDELISLDSRLVLLIYMIVTSLLFLGNWLTLIFGFGVSMMLWHIFKLRWKEFWEFLGGVKILLLFLLGIALIHYGIGYSTDQEMSQRFIQFLIPGRIFVSLSILFSIRMLLPMHTLRDCIGWYVGLFSKQKALQISISILVVFASLGQLLRFTKLRTEALIIRGISAKKSPLLWIRLQSVGILSEAAIISKELSEGVYLKSIDQDSLGRSGFSLSSSSRNQKVIQLAGILGIVTAFLGILWVEGRL